mmetsp:Transcript_1341/g.4365  ORF Transcript_1341/g.4365 Transcript_1341/m.4365 type:complete len:121 (+) Transcript_1341:3-365(+)
MLRSRCVAAARRTCVAPSRGLAKKAKPAASGSAAPAAEPGVNAVRGCNILKEGEDPTMKPDEEYPEWLWTIHIPKPGYEELVAKAETQGPDSLTHDEARWLLRGYAKARIKEHNVRRAKK